MNGHTYTQTTSSAPIGAGGGAGGTGANGTNSGGGGGKAASSLPAYTQLNESLQKHFEVDTLNIKGR
jgi:hypothetical protein